VKSTTFWRSFVKFPIYASENSGNQVFCCINFAHETIEELGDLYHNLQFFYATHSYTLLNQRNVAM